MLAVIETGQACKTYQDGTEALARICLRGPFSLSPVGRADGENVTFAGNTFTEYVMKTM
jgi:hypothetical protein